MTEMVSSATEFVRSGFSEEDSAQLAQVAELYRNVADAEISSAESAQFITSQIKAFNLDANDAITILDQLNAVSNNYAVSSTDIATALSKTSSAMATLGNTSQETIGLVTAGTEQLTGQASKVAKGLRTIGLNIAKTATNSGELNYQIGNTTKNISLLDKSTGDIKSTFQVLSEIAEDWDKMSNAEKTAIGQTLAGKNQYEVFSAVLNQFDDAISATQTALDSQGSAMEENSKYMESMGAKLNALKAQFQELVLGDGGLNTFLKNLVDLGTNLLKFANSDIGQVVIKVTLLITTITLLSKAFDLLKTSALKNVTFDHFIAWVQIATSGTYGFKIALDQLKLSILSNPLFVGTLIFVGITKFIKYCNENAESVKNLKEHIDELEASTKSLQSEYDTLSSKSNLTEAEQNRLDLLNAQIEANKILIQQEAQKAYEKEYREESGATDFRKASRGGRVVNTGNEDEKTEVDSLIESYNELNNTKSKTLDQDDESISKKAELIEALTKEADRLNKYKEDGADLYDDSEKRLDQINDIIDSYNEENGALDNNSNAISDSTNEIENSSDSLKDLASSIGMTTNELENNASAMNMSVDEYADMVSQQNELNDSLDNIQSTYGILAGAVDEYNQNGYYSIDTLQKLLKLDPQYLTMLQNDNGQMKVNTSTLQANINKKLESAKTTIYDTAMKKLNALESEHEATALNADYTQRRLHVGIVREETNALSDNTKQKVLNKAASLKGKGVGASGVDKVISEMNAQLSAVANTVKGLNVDFRTTTNTATSGTKKATNAVKKQISAEDKLAEKLKKKKEHLEDIKDNYETVFDYMKDVVEEEIDKLNDKRDKEIAKIDKKRKKLEETYTKEKNAINTQIKLLELEEEAKLKAYDETIDSLNNQKDAVEDYYDTEIDKLQNVNDAISDQIKLQEYQEALARAKASKKMVLGESGFEYREDEESVASKTQDLQQYQSEKARQDAIDALQNQKDIQVKALEAQIAYQEQMKAETQEYYDTEIEKLNTQLDALENMYDAFNTAYDEQEEKINNKYDALIKKKNNYLDKLDKAEKEYERLQAKQLAKVLYGKNFENQTNAQRLANLQSFVTAYNATLSQLGNVSTSLTNAQNKTSSTTTSKKATGDASIDSDGAYIVGDSPNTELVIGSKLNGVPMNLSKGTGVVNAKSTKTLAGLFNSLNGLSSNTPNNSTSNVSQDIIIENVNLNNVTDGQSFINEIKQFRNNMIQKSYSF